MKKILLTGATDGIGLETAKLLAAQDHHLLIHGRNEDKLKKVQQSLQASHSQAVIDYYCADLSNFSDVRQMLQSILKTHQDLDVIINNAGVFKTPNPITDDGLDVRFVVNTFSPYIITKTLLPMLADDGRIVNLSSAAQSPVNPDAMKGISTISDAFKAYAQSKLAITIWSQEMAKTLKPEQVVVAVNPGSMLASKMVKEGFGVAGNDLSIGSAILVRSALSDDFSNVSGEYFDNDSAQFSAPHSDAQNQSKCNQVMVVIEEVVADFYGSLDIN